jgi:hypothetical protein
MEEKRKRGRPRKYAEGQKPVYVPTGGKRGRPRKSDSSPATVSFLSKPKSTNGKRGRPSKNKVAYVIKTKEPKAKSRTATIVKINSGKYDMSYLVGRKVRLKERPHWLDENLYYGVISSPGYEGVDMAFAHDELELH